MLPLHLQDLLPRTIAYGKGPSCFALDEKEGCRKGEDSRIGKRPKITRESASRTDQSNAARRFRQILPASLVDWKPSDSIEKRSAGRLRKIETRSPGSFEADRRLVHSRFSSSSQPRETTVAQRSAERHRYPETFHRLYEKANPFSLEEHELQRDLWSDRRVSGHRYCTAARNKGCLWAAPNRRDDRSRPSRPAPGLLPGIR
ncbi:hypothetical protein MAMC_00692 [Methylacidimicrobium cyclopophantes]|uniref:Uncharacterized protein n=1 Tax=Methylacidimicrobium cyclopophantes TaxID=1041766 RepID=A0A5E6MCS5_9BACT|nr:hypothetical protein MAMC_00692 [Methylacidimicrobium cyclopophantes]